MTSLATIVTQMFQKRIKNNMSRSGVELTMTLNVHAETPPVVMTVWQRG